MYAFALILLLILISGLIAYIGDQIGMKLGKKRVSIFGLRPRYSSIIITVLTGIVIASLSIVILLTAYSGLRQALFNINEVMARLDQLDSELMRRTEELDDLRQERQELEDSLALTQEEYEEASGELEETREEYEEAARQLAEAREEITELERDRDELDYLVEDLRQERDELEDQIEELNLELAEVNEDLEEAREQLVYYMDEDIVYRRGEIVYSSVIEGGRSENEIINDLNEFLSEANRVASQRQIQTDEDTGMSLHLQTEDILHAAQVIYNVEPGEQLIVSLSSRMNVPRHDALRADIHINRNFVVFEEDEEVGSKRIDASSSTSDIDRKLRELLTEVNQESSRRGLLQDMDGTVGALDFINFYQLVQDIRSHEGMVDVEVRASEKIWRQDRLSDNIDFVITELDEAEEDA